MRYRTNLRDAYQLLRDLHLKLRLPSFRPALFVALTSSDGAWQGWAEETATVASATVASLSRGFDGESRVEPLSFFVNLPPFPRGDEMTSMMSIFTIFDVSNL